MTSVPKPVQTPHPPLWIAARDPNTFDFAAKNGCNIMSTPLQRPHDEVIALCERFEETVRNNPQVRKVYLGGGTTFADGGAGDA